MSQPPFPIADLPEIAGMVAYVCERKGRSREETEVALHLAGELMAAGRSNPVEILREIERHLEQDLATLMNDAQARRSATRSALLTYRETGAKAGVGKPSPHASHRSSQRQPGARWDLEEGR